MRALSILPLLLACAGAEAATLTISFTGLPSNKGAVMVAVYASEAAYKAKDPIAKARIPADGALHAEFHELPPGQYAVTAYQDENLNGRMDKNFMGIPSEAYGFSRNPPIRFGPPEFSASAVAVGKENLAIEIQME
jgi:uncharacterized protein (DUF2141 family)